MGKSTKFFTGSERQARHRHLWKYSTVYAKEGFLGDDVAVLNASQWLRLIPVPLELVHGGELLFVAGLLDSIHPGGASAWVVRHSFDGP
jgi:hypothetical protein